MKGIQGIRGVKGPVRLYLEKHPNATTDEVLDACKIDDERKVYQARNSMKQALKKKKGKKEVSTSLIVVPPTQPNGTLTPAIRNIAKMFRPTVTLEIPKQGAVIKLTDTRFSLGTLEVNHDGVIFLKPNSKKKDAKILSWGIIQRLSELGLLPVK